MKFFEDMAITQRRSKRKVSGGRYHKGARKKRLFESGQMPTSTSIGKTKRKTVRVRSANTKQRLLKVEFANVVGKDGKTAKAKITSVTENKANKNFVRMNIITKGSIIETEKGKARVTSRPGQDGIVNATLI